MENTTTNGSTSRPTLPSLHSLQLPGVSSIDTPIVPNALARHDFNDCLTPTPRNLKFSRNRQASTSSTISSYSTWSSRSRSNSPSAMDTDVPMIQSRRSSLFSSASAPDYHFTASTFEEANALLMVLAPEPETGKPAKSYMMVGPKVDQVRRVRHRLSSEKVRVHPYRLTLRPSRRLSADSSSSCVSSEGDDA